MKQSEVSKLNVQELTDKLQEFQKKYTDLKVAHAITPLENPVQLRSIRKTVARIQTALTQRELQ